MGCLPAGLRSSPVLLFRAAENVDEKFKLSGERATENGRTFWNVTSYSSTLEPKSMEVKYDNLFNGNWLLGESFGGPSAVPPALLRAVVGIHDVLFQARVRTRS